MDLRYKIYLARAENELNLSQILERISNDKKMQINVFGFKEDTYYSAVITHAYYTIFYAAKAYLVLKGIHTNPPEEHKKTFEEFSKIVEEGVLDLELLKLYHKMIIRADTLLHIFELEKSKRGTFTYRRLPQANKEPAQKSILNAKTFFKNLFHLCETNK